MKVKVLNRSETECTRQRAGDFPRVHRNHDPKLHPFERAREYTRALNAAKLDRVFAKPFVSAFEHAEGVTCLARNSKRLNCVLSGTHDGTIHLWDIPGKRCLRKLVGHKGTATGVAVTEDGEGCISCSSDCTVKLWKVPAAPFEGGPLVQDSTPVLEFQGSHAYKGCDHHWDKKMFATCGAGVSIWSHDRMAPIKTFEMGSDSVSSVRFNPVEPDLLGSAGYDRSVMLYDLRTNTTLRKLVMQTRCNALSWNPMEAMNFTVANEDCNLYTFDMRNFKKAKTVHKGFVSSVMDVDYSPTGQEFVAGSYDRTLRIFESDGWGSRDVYFGERMQRVFSVRFSGDASYVFSGSDDMNLRVWKAKASEQLGVVLPNEAKKHTYNEALIKRFKHTKEVGSIHRNRKIPGPILRANKLRRVIQAADNKKLENRIKHSKPGTVKRVSERKKKIVAELE
ncbi:hypothetical protein BSKO_06336 [Bryopsis sp. KO-2023]|nr:hypothetical protein BSKO_06336 [Bryopsis sp. KO-2023]